MAINKVPPSGGVMSSKAFKIGVGYATGGPAGAALAAASPGSPASKAGGIASTVSAFGSKGGNTGQDMGAAVQQVAPTDSPAYAANAIKSTDIKPQVEESAMTRYMAKPKTPEDQLQAVNMGIYALNSAPPEVRDEYAPSLFRTQIALERQMGKRR